MNDSSTRGLQAIVFLVGGSHHSVNQAVSGAGRRKKDPVLTQLLSPSYFFWLNVSHLPKYTFPLWTWTQQHRLEGRWSVCVDICISPVLLCEMFLLKQPGPWLSDQWSRRASESGIQVLTSHFLGWNPKLSVLCEVWSSFAKLGKQEYLHDLLHHVTSKYTWNNLWYLQRHFKKNSWRTWLKYKLILWWIFS